MNQEFEQQPKQPSDHDTPTGDSPPAKQQFKSMPQYSSQFQNQPDSDHSPQVSSTAKRPGIRQWYQTRTRKVKLSLGCGVLLSVLLLCSVASAAIGSRGSLIPLLPSLWSRGTPTNPAQGQPTPISTPILLATPPVTTIPSPGHTPTATLTHKSRSGHTYYVSKNGNNADGTSWASAWNELNQINWSNILPGDTLFIDGGTTGMTYSSTLSIGKSGIAGSPITIQRATDTGHTGTVVFFGGSSTPLPYCGQTNWTAPTGTIGDAINMNGKSWITIDGGAWDGIKIHGFTYLTVYYSGGESNDTMKNLEIYDNGSAFQGGGGWNPDLPGVALHGDNLNLTFTYMNIHDNGQDNFQAYANGADNNLTVTYSWLHYTRTMPGIPSEAYNLCTHNDGFQIFGTTPSSNITFQHDVLGPGLTNGLIFQPKETNVTLSDSLVIDPGSNVTVENTDTSSNWTIDHVTAIGQSDNLTLEGTGNTVTNSIFYDGNLLLNNSISNSSNNCKHTPTNTNQLSGQVVDPQFMTDLSSYPVQTTDITQYPAISFLQNADFSLRSTSPCKGLGSSITSVSQFLTTVTT